MHGFILTNQYRLAGSLLGYERMGRISQSPEALGYEHKKRGTPLPASAVERETKENGIICFSLRSNSLAKAVALIARDSLCANRFKERQQPAYCKEIRTMSTPASL